MSLSAVMKFRGNGIFWTLFVLVLLAGMGFRIYKAHSAGIVYDEAFTSLHFEADVYKSPTLEHPNFHVLTAIFNRWAHDLFGSYEHFVRIPALLFAVILLWSLAYMIHKAIDSKLLKIMFFGLVSFSPFVFDLSFLARGYSIALGAIYAEFALIVWLLGHKIKYRNIWIPIVAISGLNFLAFGAVPSTIWMLSGMNIIFVLFYSFRAVRDVSGKLKPILTNLISIPILSFIPLYFLYRKNFREILEARDQFGGEIDFWPYVKQLLMGKVINVDSGFNTVVYYIFLSLIGLILVFFVCRFLIGVRKGAWKKMFGWPAECVFIVTIMCVTLVEMLLHREVFHLRLGFLRNGVVLIPLFLITCGILCDKFCQKLGNRWAVHTAQGVVTVLVFLMMALNLPSPHLVKVRDWDRQSVAGPILHKLRAIDPNRLWKISRSKEMVFLNLPFAYYQRFGYKIQYMGLKSYDVVVVHRTEMPKNVMCLDKDYFDRLDCWIVVNPKLAGSGVFPEGLLSMSN